MNNLSIKDLINNIKNNNLDKLNKYNIKYNNYDIFKILYLKYNSLILNDYQRDCRSVIIDNNYNIISYSYENLLENNDGINYLLKNNIDLNNIDLNNIIITEAYEGTTISIFNYNDKWYLSTRKCINLNDSIDNPQFIMFNELLTKNNYKNLDDFCNKLDKNNSYHYILIHHNNKNYIDYKFKFGDNYTKLCLVTIRDNNLNEININDNPIYSYDYSNNDIFIPTIYDKSTLDNFFKIKDILNNNWSMDLNIEGIIIKHNTKIIKLQTLNYEFNKTKTLFGKDNNIYKSLLLLFQKNKLYNYLINNIYLKDIYFNNKYYNLINIINQSLKYLSSIILELCIYYWNNNDIINYNNLPKIYKYILYNLKGIYKKNIYISNVYYYLKNISILKLLLLLFNINKISTNYDEPIIILNKLLFNI